MAATVPHGVYFGFTLAEMLDELDRYKAAMKKQRGGVTGAVISASENGSSFSFGAGEMSMRKWQIEIQNALNLLDSCAYPLGVSSQSVFGAV
jgi:hypothetical protein